MCMSAQTYLHHTPFQPLCSIHAMPRYRSQGTSTATLPGSQLDAAGGVRAMQDVGAVLGRLAATCFMGDVMQFEREVQRADSAMHAFLLLMRGARVNRRTRRLTRNFTTLGRHHRRHRWYWLLIAEAFGLYCLLRQRATPLGRQPRLTEHTRTLPRRLAVELRRRGLQRAIARERGLTIRRRAAQAMRELWTSMRGVHVCLWVDNFYRPATAVNPLRARANLNATVVAVLHCPRLPPAPVMASVVDLSRRRHVLARLLYR